MFWRGRFARARNGLPESASCSSSLKPTVASHRLATDIPSMTLTPLPHTQTMASTRFSLSTSRTTAGTLLVLMLLAAAPSGIIGARCYRSDSTLGSRSLLQEVAADATAAAAAQTEEDAGAAKPTALRGWVYEYTTSRYLEKALMARMKLEPPTEGYVLTADDCARRCRALVGCVAFEFCTVLPNNCGFYENCRLLSQVPAKSEPSPTLLSGYRPKAVPKDFVPSAGITVNNSSDLPAAVTSNDISEVPSANTNLAVICKGVSASAGASGAAASGKCMFSSAVAFEVPGAANTTPALPGGLLVSSLGGAQAAASAVPAGAAAGNATSTGNTSNNTGAAGSPGGVSATVQTVVVIQLPASAGSTTEKALPAQQLQLSPSAGPATAAADCCRLCAGHDGGCAAFTWVAPQAGRADGTCHLYNQSAFVVSHMDARTSSQVTSGFYVPAVP